MLTGHLLGNKGERVSVVIDLNFRRDIFYQDLVYAIIVL